MDDHDSELSFERIMYCVAAELQTARDKFPNPEKLLAAFNEEAGEVTKAMLDHHQGKCEAKDVFKECVQTIAMAIRLIQEGDPDFKYKPEYSHYADFETLQSFQDFANKSKKRA